MISFISLFNSTTSEQSSYDDWGGLPLHVLVSFRDLIASEIEMFCSYASLIASCLSAYIGQDIVPATWPLFPQFGQHEGF